MTVLPKNDTFTYFSGRGDADTARPADVVAALNPDGTKIGSTDTRPSDVIDLLKSIDTRLVALYILLNDSYGRRDDPVTALNDVKDLRTLS